MSALLLCLRAKTTEVNSAKITTWPSLDDALDAATRECSTLCQGRHTVVVRDGCQFHLIGGLPPVPPLDEELRKLYGTHLYDGELLPAPPSLNEDFDRPTHCSPLPQRLNRGHAVALARATAVVP